MPTVDGGNAYSTFGADPTAGTYGPVTKTVGEVFRSVKRTFGDESSVQLEDQDIVAWINDAQMEIVKTNSVLKARSTIGSVVGKSEYTLPLMDIHKIDSVHFNGVRIPNMPFAQVENQMLDKTMSNAGGPIFWYEWAGRITFYPSPDVSAPIEVYYTAKPVPITGDQTAFLSVPDKYFRSIVDYVLARAYEMDEDWNAAQAKNTQFSEGVNMMGEEERTAQNMTYPVVQVIDDWL